MDVAPGMEIKTQQAHGAWRAADRIRRLSDRLIGIGPFGIGLDGVLAWVPGVGSLYSLAAGGLLIFYGFRAGVSIPTLGRMAGFLAVDSASSTVPIVGWTIDTLFPGHLMAAEALQKDVERRHGLPPEVAGLRRKSRTGKRLRKPFARP
jgi:hypothetical protein